LPASFFSAGDNRKGAACLVASAFGFALMAFFVRLCDSFGGEISCFQKGFFRNVVALAIALCVSVSRRRDEAPRARAEGSGGKVLALLVMRSVFGTVGIFANFYALSKIHIGDAMTLNKTAPFFTVLFSWMFLGERIGAKGAAILAFAFCGAALVMKPGFGGADAFPAAAALVGGLGAGAAYACVHRLGTLRCPASRTVVFFSAFSCILSLPLAAATYSRMTLAQLFILLGAGAGAAIGQFGVTAAYRYSEPRSIAAFDYMNVIFTAMFGFFFFGQVPDMLSVAGFAVIFAAAMLSAAMKTKTAQGA